MPEKPARQYSFQNPPSSDPVDSDSWMPLADTPSCKDSGSYYLDLGDRHYYSYLTRSLTRDLETAIRHYRRALEMEPGLSQAYVKLASALWDKGDINLDHAINYCQLALTYNPDNADAYVFLGYFFKRLGESDKAITQFRKALTIQPWRLPKARIALGITLIRDASLHRQSLAINRVRQVSEGLTHFLLGFITFPLDRQAFSQLIQAFSTDAQIHGLMLMGQWFQWMNFRTQVRHVYERGTRQLPGEPIFYHLLGDHYQSMNRHDTSIYFYNRALERDPENLSLHRKLGKAYSLCNDLTNAVQSLEKAVAQDVQDVETRYDLAQIYTERQEFIRALYYFKEVLRHQPENPYVHSNMAYVLFKLEDYDGAIEEYRHAVNYGQDPLWTATVAQTLGTIYYQAKQDLEAALAAFTLAHELDPENLECLSMLAELSFEQGNLDGALKIYEHILQRDPENPDNHNYVGYLLWQMDRNVEAIECYRKALTYDPNNVIAHNNLGVIYLDEMYNASEAGIMFARALELKPDYTLAAFNLGRTLELKGETTQAAKMYAQAQVLNATHPELTDDEIRERIDGLFRIR